MGTVQIVSEEPRDVALQSWVPVGNRILDLRNRKRFPCLHWVMVTRVDVWENEKKSEKREAILACEQE